MTFLFMVLGYFTKHFLPTQLDVPNKKVFVPLPSNKGCWAFT